MSNFIYYIAERHYAECHYGECRIFIILPNVIMLTVMMLSVVVPPQVPMLLNFFLHNFMNGPNELDCLSLLSCLMLVGSQKMPLEVINWDQTLDKARKV